MVSHEPAGRFPRKMVLFSGHMIDAPYRPTPRLRASRESVAATAISPLLDQIGVADSDLAICGGACGGDLLFAESALARGNCVSNCISRCRKTHFSPNPSISRMPIDAGATSR
jgi:hypothetical protein